MQIPIWQAIAYGLVQGLGEFLPISSSAHLVILPWAAGWQDPGLAFDVALHVGTLVALVGYFFRDLVGIARAFVRSVVERRIGDDPERRLAWLVVLGSIPGGLAGFALEKAAESALRAPWIIATTMMALGALLFAADRLAPARRVVGDMRLRDALFVGFAQAAAIVPGVSRSGSTITAGRLLGLDRHAAARFSFLLSLPITLGASVLKVPKLVRAGGFDLAVAVGMIVAAVSGYLAIAWMLRLVRARSYLPFVVYRMIFGLAILGAVWSGLRTAG